jgi:hypothetical protein
LVETENKLNKYINTLDIKRLIDEMHSTFEKLQAFRNQAKDELSLIDRELSNHYHNIEGADIEYMTDSHMMVMKLKDILYQRREAKINHTLLESFVSALERTMNKTKKRSAEIVKKHDEIKQEIIDRAK